MTLALPIAENAAKRPNRKERRRAEKLKLRHARRSGDKASVLIQQAALHHAAGRFSEAEAHYRQVLAEEPEHFAAVSRLGAMRTQEQRHQEACDLLEQAISIDPSHGPTRMNLGIAYSGLGRIEEADTQFRKGLELSPSDPETLKNYGSWCRKAGRLQEAAAIVERYLNVAPNDIQERKSLAANLAGLGRLQDTIDCFRKILAQVPDDAEAQGNLGSLLAAQGNVKEAIPHLVEGFSRLGDKQEYQTVLIDAIRESPADAMGSRFEEIYCRCFESGLVEGKKLSAPAGAYLWLKYLRNARVEESEGTAGRQMHLDGILGDRLLLHLLEKTINVCPELEQILIPLRQVLLFKAPAEPALSEKAMDFMASFALQCHNNSYVYPISNQERLEIQRLEDDLAARIQTNPQVDAALETRLAVYAMYQPLHRLRGFERLLDVPPGVWSDALLPVIERTLLYPTEEEQLKSSIATLGKIDDQVSKAVRSQYEDNPYPRWIALPPPQPMSLAQFIRGESGMVSLPVAPPEGPFDCLVAGCGTGRHPITLALAMPQARVTAVDLSLSSLAYAKRMARKLDASNIDFLHGDLLDLDALDQGFELIECAGVLHHMKEPERGLESLLKVSKPGTYLRLGLYSRLARAHIIEARQQIQEQGLASTPDAIRAFRQEIMRRPPESVLKFLGQLDFFDLDSLRDLLFHVQEHQFTVPELKAMLARYGLTFLGFTGLSPGVFRSFRERFTGSSDPQDLDCWQAFEEANPDTFIGMYQFWCRRND